MYKMYNAQWDGDSDDDKNSLSSSFWSDGERQEEEEAVEVSIERLICEDDSKPVTNTEDSLQEASEEEKPELNKRGKFTLEGGSDEDEESCSSSSGSPAPSLMTSGYGTYRPEEQEGGDYRDDHTITEFDQDSRADLSEMRDDEQDDRSLCSFGVEPAESEYGATRPQSALADAEPEANVACCEGEGLHEQVGMKPEEDQGQADEEEREEDLHAASEHEVTDATSEEQQHVAVVEGGSVEVDKVESDDPDDSSSNKDIKFIDSKVDFNHMTFDKMCEEWEGNLRHQKASCLDERLAELQLSSTAQHDFEAENEEVTSQSDAQSSESGGISLSAFESYIRGMTRTRSEGDLRPKPKSFIRPAMGQQTIKKTDPVAKYFQYKQLWEMFKLPGEKDRRDLRWEIKERLAYQPPPPKPQRVYVPNTYTVPTEKKRSALRWEIRNDLANGLLPHKFSYRF